jgi:hypothetical protein
MDRYEEGSLPDDEGNLDEYSFFIRISPEKRVLVNPEAVNNVLFGTPFSDTLAGSVSSDTNGVLKAKFDEFEAAGINVTTSYQTYNAKQDRKVLRTKKQITLAAMNKYMKLIKDNNLGSEKEAQIFFYILFNRLLMPSSDSNLTATNILCGDLEKIETINWSKVICKHLKEGIIKRREKKSDSVAWGCTIVLAVSSLKEFLLRTINFMFNRLCSLDMLPGYFNRG